MITARPEMGSTRQVVVKSRRVSNVGMVCRTDKDSEARVRELMDRFFSMLLCVDSRRAFALSCLRGESDEGRLGPGTGRFREALPWRPRPACAAAPPLGR